ncbi:MAG: hypothetical protein QOH46_2572 [Solirubrobacteraceae bacterium]|nr:hypothetical protein [Solirubrobacteraceae bacterium]
MHALDSWAAETGLERLDVVKLDVEGAEILALRGMGEPLRRLRPGLVVVEVQDVVMRRGPGDETALHALMGECGHVATGQVVKHDEVFRPAASGSGGDAPAGASAASGRRARRACRPPGVGVRRRGI